MWNISRIKQEARNGFKRFGYWMPLLITILYSLISGGTQYFSGFASSATITPTFTFPSTHDFDYHELPELLNSIVYYAQDLFNEFFSNPFLLISTSLIIIVGFLFAIVISWGWDIFVKYPFEVGKARYFMEHRAFDSKFSKFFWSFRSGRYLNIVKIMFLCYLKIWLWSLLFIIPGIIKAYQYRMIPYILAENPNITTERAFELTKQMTKGEKWHIFVLDLSFIGWHILCLFSCGIGETFLRPYIDATNAELYQVMREKAHGLNFSDFAELPGFFPEQV